MPYRSDTYAREARQKSEKLRRIAEVGLIGKMTAVRLGLHALLCGMLLQDRKLVNVVVKRFNYGAGLKQAFNWPHATMLSDR